MKRNITKPGAHGTLTLFSVTWTDGDPGRPPHMCVQRLWAYDKSHAAEKFGDAEDNEGCSITSIESVQENA